MKKVLSIALVVLLTASSIFSFQKAYSQSEEDNVFVHQVEHCTCVSSNGGIIVFADILVCYDGGDEPCIFMECPMPPAGCIPL